MGTVLLRGARIWTLGPSDQAIEHGALLIDGDRIQAIGSEGSLPSSLHGLEIDLSGLDLLPGLIDCHTHLSLTHLRGIGPNLALVPWLQEIGVAISELTDADVESATQDGCHELLRSGVTCLCDCGPNGPGRVAAVATAIGMRSISGLMVRSEWLGKPVPSDLARDVAETRRLMAHWATRSELPSFFLGAHSLYCASPELLRGAKAAANDLGLAFNLHLAESGEEVETLRARAGLSPIQYANSLGLLDAHTIANHCVQASLADLDILAHRGTRVVHCPASNAKLGSGIAPVAEMRERTIPVGLGTDSAASNDDLNMFWEMKLAVLLARALGRDAARLTALDAIRMCTSEAARVVGLEREIGTLAVGKKADLIAVEQDAHLRRRASAGPSLDEMVFAAGQAHVRLVMVDGRIVLNELDGGRRQRNAGQSARTRG